MYIIKKKNFKNFLLIISGITLILLSFYVNEGNPILFKDKTFHKKGSIVIPYDFKDGFTLIPSKVSDSANKGILALFYSRLIKPDVFFDVQGDILKKWEFDRSNNKYTFHIKNNAVFSNGQEITSKDVIFSIHEWTAFHRMDSNLLLSIKGAHEWTNGTKSNISGLKRLNSKTFEVYLKYNDTNFITNLTTPRFVIFPYNFNNDLNYFKNPIGSGPFILTSFSKKQIILKKNKKYFSSNVKLDKITLTNASFSDLQSLLDKKTIDGIFFHNTLGLKVTPNYKKQKIRSYKKLMLIFNEKTLSFTRNLEIRKYITYHLLNTEILKKCFVDQSITTNIIPKGMIGHSKKNYIEKNLNLRLKEVTKKIAKTINVRIEDFKGAECYSKNINEIFIKNKTPIKVIPTSFNKMFKMFKNNTLKVWFELLTFKNEDPYSVLQYFGPNSEEFLTGKADARLSKLYERLKSDLPENDRYNLYIEIENELKKNFKVVPFLNIDDYVIFKKNLTPPFAFGSIYYIQNWHEIGLQNE